MRAFFAVLLLGLTACSARAAEVRDLALSTQGDQLLASFHLAGSFDPRMTERIASGLPTTLVYEVELMSDRKRWFDRGLADTTLTVVGIYDAVRREYLVNFKLGGRLLETRVVHDLAELEAAMTRIADLPVFTMPAVEEGKRILVRVRAELGMSHLLGFIPSRLTTDWVESNKIRVRPAAP